MRSPGDDGQPAAPAPDAPPKLIRGARTKARLAAACVAVLSGGAWLAPRDSGEQAPPQEKVAPMLQAESDRREPARVFRALQQAGRQAAALTVAVRAPSTSSAPTLADYLRPLDRPRPESGFGVMVSSDRALTHIGALRGRPEPILRLADGSLSKGKLIAWEPETGVAVLQLEATTGTPLEAARLSAVPTAAGELAVAAARHEAGDLVAPVFIASRGPGSHSVTIASALSPPGTPIFTLAGEVLAIAAGSPSVVAYPAAEALERLQRLTDAGRALPASIGVSLQAITPRLAPSFRDRGILVSDVALELPAARAGLRPGDVITSVAGEPVERVEDAIARIAALPAGKPVTVAVRRDGKEIEHDVTPQLTLEASAPLERDPTSGAAPRAADLLTADRLEGAAIPPDARVLTIGGVAVDARSAPLALKRAKSPVVLWLERDGRRFFAALDASR